MIIAIANQKGGVAKTTTAINLAAGLQVAGYKVLLIDVGPQEDATSVLMPSHQPPEEDRSLYEVLVKFAPLKNVTQKTQFDNLYLGPSHLRLSGLDLELANALDNRSERLKRAIEPVVDQYDHIIIDTPPWLGLLTVNALTASDSVLIPVSSNWFALRGLSHLQETIDMVRQQLNPSLAVLGVLHTKFREGENVSKDTDRLLREHFGDVVFETIIPKNNKVEEAHSRYTHVLDYAPNSKGAQAYKALVKEVLAR